MEDEALEILKRKTAAFQAAEDYKGDDAWVEGVIFNAIECLRSGKLPDCGKDCDFCLSSIDFRVIYGLK